MRKLKALFVGILAMLVAANIMAGPPAAPEGYRWEVVSFLTDEFNDDTVDETKWNKFNPTWGGRPPGQFKEYCVTEGGGNLRLKSVYIPPQTNDIWIHTGFLSAKDTRAVKPGMYVETRLKCPQDGTVAGFWFSGDEHQEIDVQEGKGWVPNRSLAAYETHMGMNTHYFYKKKEEGVCSDLIDLKTPSHIEVGGNVGDAYHTYGVWWIDGTGCTMYHNGNVAKHHTFKLPPGDFLNCRNPNNEFWETPSYTAGMQLNLNAETQTWIGDPNITYLQDDSRNTTYVDYVRTWRLVKISDSTDPTVWFEAEKNDIIVGQTIQLQAHASPDTSTITWESGDEEVVTVTDNGEIKGISLGFTTITASVGGGAGTVSSTVNVVNPTINIIEEDVSVVMGTSVLLNKMDFPRTISSEWSSPNTEIASITSNGEVTGVGLGEVYIFSTINGIKDSCLINIILPEIDITRSTLSLEEGKAYSLRAKTNSKLLVVNWYSSDEELVEVSSEGKITTKKEGVASVYATIDGTEISDSCIITVTSTTSISTGNEDVIKLHPNPTNGIIYLSNSDIITQVTIYDTRGVILVDEKKINSLIDISSLTHGLYILQVKTNDNKVFVRNVLKN